MSTIENEFDESLCWGEEGIYGLNRLNYSASWGCITEGCKLKEVALTISGGKYKPIGVKRSPIPSKSLNRDYAIVFQCPECKHITWSHIDNLTARVIYRIFNKNKE